MKKAMKPTTPSYLFNKFSQEIKNLLQEVGEDGITPAGVNGLRTYIHTIYAEATLHKLQAEGSAILKNGRYYAA